MQQKILLFDITLATLYRNMCSFLLKWYISIFVSKAIFNIRIGEMLEIVFQSNTIFTITYNFYFRYSI